MMPPEIICTTPFPAAPAVRERPILFSGSMVRALLAGTKTQTRRALRVQPPDTTQSFHLYHHPDPRPHHWAMDGGSLLDFAVPCPYGQIGDRLYVRETFDPIYPQDPSYNGGRPIEYDYRATYNHGDRLGDSLGIKKTWRPAIHMPREASRILLEVTDVRVERLQAISRGDAMAEGCPFPNMAQGDDPRKWYAGLWNELNGAGAWGANPWVWAVSFRRVPPKGGITQTPPGGSTA